MKIYVYLLLFSKFLQTSVTSIKTFNLKKCNTTAVIIDLDSNVDAVIKASYVNYSVGTFSCRFTFVTKELYKNIFRIFNLQLFEVRSLSSGKVSASIYFSTPSTSLFLINFHDGDMKIKDLFLTSLLVERQFNWGESLIIEIRIKSPSVTNFIFVINPGRLCIDAVGKTMFKCEGRYYQNKVCIEETYKCNGYINCVSDNSDEAIRTCRSQLVYHIILPSLVLSCTVFVLGWVLIRIIPCIVNHRRLLMLRNNRLSMHADISQFYPDQGFFYQNSETNLTPDNIPQSPPKYQNVFQPNDVDHQLPPSYSEGSGIGVIPEFFKRFFGKPRSNQDYKFAKALNDSEDIIKRLETRSDPIFCSNSPMSKIEETDSSSTTSDLSTSVVLADVFLNFSST